LTATPDHGHAQGRSYNEVRERLKALGYLEKPLDRFLLGGIARPGSFVRRHAAVSLKVAAMASPLLGALFALAVVLANRPRLSRPLDAALLALYYSIAFGLLIFILEMTAGLILASIVRWRRRGVAALQATATRAGFAVSLVLSAYLALWWRRRAAPAAGPLLDFLGVLGLVLVNGALLRISSLASLAALIRASDLPPAGARSERRGRYTWSLLAAGLLAAGFLIAPAGVRVPPTLAFERIPVPGRLLVVGWDGISREDFLSMRDQDGRPPASRGAGRWMLAGLRGPVGGPVESRPAFWTSIATGRSASEHGVGDVEAERMAGLSSPLAESIPLGAALEAFVPGHRVAVSAGSRRARTVWEILSEKEGAGAVGWWATWPAIEPARGRALAVVSDRAVFGLRRGRMTDDDATPTSLRESLQKSAAGDIGTVREWIEKSLGSGATRLPPLVEDAALIDGYAALLAGHLMDGPSYPVVVVYLPGLDIVRAGAQGNRPSMTGAVGGPGFLRYERGLVDRLSAGMGEDDWIVIVGDPGRGGGRKEPRDGSEGPRHGFVFVSGPGCTGAMDPETWDPLDVVPTILYLRGFPKSRELRGTVRSGFLDAGWRGRLRQGEIGGYGDSPSPPAAPLRTDDEDETLERLRSLGYVR
jgi:hypothetical protein